MKTLTTFALFVATGCAAPVAGNARSEAPGTAQAPSVTVQAPNTQVSPPLPDRPHIQQSGWLDDTRYAFCADHCGATECEIHSGYGLEAKPDAIGAVTESHSWPVDLVWEWRTNPDGGIDVDMTSKTGVMISHSNGDHYTPPGIIFGGYFSFSKAAESPHLEAVSLSPDGKTIAVVGHGLGTCSEYDVDFFTLKLVRPLD